MPSLTPLLMASFLLASSPACLGSYGRPRIQPRLNALREVTRRQSATALRHPIGMGPCSPRTLRRLRCPHSRTAQPQSTAVQHSSTNTGSCVRQPRSTAAPAPHTALDARPSPLLPGSGLAWERALPPACLLPSPLRHCPPPPHARTPRAAARQATAARAPSTCGTTGSSRSRRSRSARGFAVGGARQGPPTTKPGANLNIGTRKSQSSTSPPE